MARPLRIEYSGAFYHVMHRGNAGSDIFKSERDREKILEYFKKAAERYKYLRCDPSVSSDISIPKNTHRQNQQSQYYSLFKL